MEENLAAVIPVGIIPKHVYGLRTEVAGNVCFNFNQEVIYPVESVLVFHDFNKNKQRYLRLPQKTFPTIMSLNPNRHLLAVVELTTVSASESLTNISVYDTANLKKRRNFQMPENARDKYVDTISFVYDSRALLVLTRHPVEVLYMMFFDKAGTVLESHIGIPNQRLTATVIAGNPQDAGLVAVAGDGIFKMLSKSETGFTSSSNVKSHFSVKCMAWLSMESLMLGLKKARLALIENGELKQTFQAKEIDLIDLSKDTDLEGEEVTTTAATSAEEVSCMIAQPKCLAYAISSEVYVFEKVSKFKYQRLAIIKLLKDIYAEELYKIKNLAINGQQDTICVTAGHSQIYVCYLKEVQVGETACHLNFQPLGQFIHIDEIVDISVCAWRSIILTASKDQTIRVWNYETDKVELVKRYQVDITVTELNATGQFAAIGFSDQLRIMQIFLDDLNIMKTYNFPRCAQVRYSFYGHLMAAAYDNYVAITSVYTLDIMKTLKGHNGDVLSLAWSRDDKYLISGGAEGAIYQWDVETGNRVHEIVQKGTEYRAIRCTGDPLSYYAVTGSGLLRQLANSEMVRELSTPAKTPFLSIALARYDLIMFISSEAGHLYNVQLPFLDAGGGTFTNYRFFDSAVTKIAFSHDDTLLITGSKRGTLVIWVLQNIDGRIAPLDQDLLKGQEVLIPRQVLKDHIEQIDNLETRLLQQAAEFEYQESQNEIFDSQQLADLHKGYCQALEALKNRNNEMEDKHIQELNAITFRINDLKAEQKKQKQTLSEQFTERMLMEYQKFTTFSQSSNEIQHSYEEKLKKSAGELQDTVEALEVDFKKQLEKREELIRELMEEIQNGKLEFYEYCRQVEAENEANMTDAVIKYENIIKAEQDAEVMWRGKAGVLKKKSDTMGKEAERLAEDVELLSEEHIKSQRTIGKLLREMDDLRKDVTDRELAISVKEKRIQEILHKNQDLEKYKQVLTHRITELKLQIEPRECQINEKRKQITELENSLDTLNKTNVRLEVQIKALTAKYVQSVAELKHQRQVAINSRETISTICTEIYTVGGFINDPHELREGIRKMFHKYANDEALKKHIILEGQVKAEFHRQRSHIENYIKSCKLKIKNRSQQDHSGHLLGENLKLLKEIEILRKQNITATKELKSLGVSLKISNRKSGNTQNLLVNTLTEVRMRRNANEDRISVLRAKISAIKDANLELIKELKELDILNDV